MHFWKKTIHLTMHLKKYFELIYKPHPTNFKNVKYYLKSFGINVTNNLKFNKNDLFPEIIFCSDSGVLYELLKKKYFCYYIDTGLKNSFLFNSRKKNLFQIFNKKNIINFTKLYNSNNLKKYKVKLPNDICKHYGKKSVDEFKKVTKKLENKNFQYFEKG